MLRKFLLLLILSVPPSAAAKITDRFDHYIQEACSRYLPGIDCDWYKALLYTESLLKPGAKSHVGARGVAQIMPGTWDENAPLVEGATDPYEARASIRVGAFYLSKTTKFWHARRPDIERLWLGMASYNAGPGNILKAQKACNNKPNWRDIQPCLQQITGKHSQETTHYVERIKRSFCRIKLDKGAGIWGLQYFRDNCINLLAVPRKFKQESRDNPIRA